MAIKILNKLRKKQETIDEKLLNLLEKRFEISLEIAKHKAKLGAKIENKHVEKDKLEKLKNSKSVNLMSKKFIAELWQRIFTESKRLQAQYIIDHSDQK